MVGDKPDGSTEKDSTTVCSSGNDNILHNGFHMLCSSFLIIRSDTRMILEMKGMFIVISMMMSGIVIGLLINTDFLLAFFLIMGMMFSIIGDVFLYVKLVNTQANRWMESNKPDQEKCILFDLAHNVTVQRVTKKEEGKREFVRYGREASIINRGRYPIRFPNGDRGFVGHESYDLDVDLVETEALDQLPGDDIKEIYHKVMRGEEST